MHCRVQRRRKVVFKAHDGRICGGSPRPGVSGVKMPRSDSRCLDACCRLAAPGPATPRRLQPITRFLRRRGGCPSRVLRSMLPSSHARCAPTVVCPLDCARLREAHDPDCGRGTESMLGVLIRRCPGPSWGLVTTVGSTGSLGCSARARARGTASMLSGIICTRGEFARDVGWVGDEIASGGRWHLDGPRRRRSRAPQLPAASVPCPFASAVKLFARGYWGLVPAQLCPAPTDGDPWGVESPVVTPPFHHPPLPTRRPPSPTSARHCSVAFPYLPTCRPGMQLHCGPGLHPRPQITPRPSRIHAAGLRDQSTTHGLLQPRFERQKIPFTAPDS